MPFAEVNGQRIHYSDSGGEGPAVVFSHGFFMDHEMFAPQVEELRPTYRSLSVDARGFGLTESDGRAFTYWDLADDLVGVLDAVGVPQAVFVGLSQGGFTTLRVALRAPGRVRGIALLDTTPDAEPEEARALYRQTRDALVGGFNAYPAEIENLLLRNEKVGQVAVVGIPDDRMGEVGMAFVVPRPGVSIGPDELVAWARDEMANYKVPRRVEIVEELPVNASGKVLKYELRSRA